VLYTVARLTDDGVGTFDRAVNDKMCLLARAVRFEGEPAWLRQKPAEAG
jgi:hypothetical protein